MLRYVNICLPLILLKRKLTVLGLVLDFILHFMKLLFIHFHGVFCRGTVVMFQLVFQVNWFLYSCAVFASLLVGVCDAVLAYTNIFAPVDMRCDLQIATNEFVNTC